VKILIITEDPTLDQHIVKPIVEAIFRDLHRTAGVEVLKDPHISGAAQALDPRLVAEIIEDNPMCALFLLVADRDCNREKHEEKAAARVQEHNGKLLAVLARQEVEVWALALHRGDLKVPWREVREHCDPKEAFFDPLVRERQWSESVGRGRKPAMRDLGRGWSGLKQVCPELGELARVIDAWLHERG
jgi:hypothetical protein